MTDVIIKTQLLSKKRVRVKKEVNREELNQAIQDFINRGGKIRRCDQMEEIAGNLLITEKVKGSTWDDQDNLHELGGEESAF